jgi:hypothetical protein
MVFISVSAVNAVDLHSQVLVILVIPTVSLLQALSLRVMRISVSVVENVQKHVLFVPLRWSLSRNQKKEKGKFQDRHVYMPGVLCLHIKM